MTVKVSDTVTISRAVLGHAQELVCSYCCPSTWETAEERPPHSGLCQAMTAALASPPSQGLRKALEKIAGQKLCDEMDPADKWEEYGDIEGAYDMMIKAARAALDPEAWASSIN